jgi:predicted NBD/HSP70 family sugar kinase
LYAINRSLAHAAGVNVEEDRVSAAVADLSGVVLGEAIVEADLTQGQSPVPPVRDALRAALRRARLPLKALHQVVVGISGAYDPTQRRIVYADHTPGVQAAEVVSELWRVARVPLTIENDANLAAIAERTRGVARDFDTFALLWVARGLGLAVELGGRVYQGATGGAGEIGYIPVGGRSVAFQDSVGSSAVIQLGRRYGIVGKTAEDVVAKAVAAGETHLPFVQELAERLAMGVATIAAVLDPPLVVLAGSTCQAGGQLLVELTQRELHRSSPFRTRLLSSSVPSNPVLVGAVDSAVAAARTEVFAASPSDPWTPSAPAVGASG